MAYAQTTFAQAQAALLLRLSDPNGVFWSATANAAGYNEIGGYIQEAMRTWGSLTGFWRDRGTFTVTSTSGVFYDLPSLLKNGSGTLIRSYGLTDAEIIAQMEFHLLEPATPASYSGSGMFTQQDLVQALQRRLNQFLFQSGCVVSHFQQPAPANQGRPTLPDSVSEIVRLAWASADLSQINRLFVLDEWEMNAFIPNWNLTSTDPTVYSIVSTPPLVVQIAGIPNSAGVLDILALEAGATLNPAAPVILGIPDDLCWALKWGAMADLLGKDGPAFDPQRAAYCEQRFQQGLELARVFPAIVHAEAQGAVAQTYPIVNLDEFQPEWQDPSTAGTPTSVGIAGLNLICPIPIPDTGTYSITLDVVANSVIPTQPTDYLQLGPEELDVVLDYAQHLASFKLGGAEFQTTLPLYQRMIKVAMDYNHYIRSSSKFLDVMKDISSSGKLSKPRRAVSTSEVALEEMELDRGQ